MSDPCVVGTFDRMSSAEEVVRKLQGGGFPVPNVIRNQIGTYDDLKKDKDGSVTLYIQNASPGKDKESNWLPAPKGAFHLAMRLYNPKTEARTLDWVTPGVKKVR